MVERISCYHVKVSKIGLPVEIRGKIIKTSPDGFTLQSVVADGIPSTIYCSFGHQVELDYVKLTGCFEVDRFTRGCGRLSFRVDTIGYVSKADALDVSDPKETYFTHKNLDALRFDTAEEMFRYLNGKAMMEGFRLTHKKSFKESCISIRCHQHLCYGKLSQLNTGCEFKINIAKSQADPKWHVTGRSLMHDHFLNAEIFAHYCLDETTRKLIDDMLDSHLQLSQILTVIYKRSGIKLSISQIRSIQRLSRKKLKICESTELYEYVNSHEGRAFYLESSDDKGNIHRQAVATFNQDELVVLETYGDFLSIDPTFSPLTSDWSIIPLTAVDEERRIRSAGIIFASSCKAVVFKWIIELLTMHLPCRDKLVTLASDDDVGLDAAFTMIESNIGSDPDDKLSAKVSSLKRVICFWHKISNFTKFLQTVSIPQELRRECIRWFHSVGMSRDRQYVEECLQKLRETDTRIAQYLEKNVSPKLQFISKAYLGNTFTCGYNTSSLAESANSQLKAFVQRDALSLLQMREAANELQRQSKLNQNFLKARKPHKARDKRIVDIMVNWNVSATIAESIIGSMQKAEQLVLEMHGTVFTLKRTITNADGAIARTETFEVKGGKCTCSKHEQTGLPCSHLLRVLSNQGKDQTEELVWNRWKLNCTKRSLTDLDLESLGGTVRLSGDKTPVSQIKSVNGRYVFLLSHGQTLASLASQNANWSQKVYERLQELEDELLHVGSDPMITDEHGTRPGRKPKKRKGIH